MSLTAGSRLGPYEILVPLGAGGMGEVYRARDTRLDREVAVKVLPARLAEDADALARFEREAKAVAALSHPNILAIHDFGRSEGLVFAVTELVEGETLRARIEGGALPPRKAVELAVQIAHGLTAAHDRGIVHRDLKPDNVIVSRDGRVKILDFGLARQSLADASATDTNTPTRLAHTEPGTVMGTVGYMSPEQVRAQPADHRSDIFSLGAILYEMLAGERAFKGESAVETMNAILKEEPPDPSVSGKSLPPALDRIVRHCLEKAPEERFQSCRDLAFDLDSLSGQSTRSGVGIAAPIEAIASRRRWITAAAVMILLIAVGAGGILAGRALSGRGGAKGPVTFNRITFRRGNVLNARFAPDGQSVIYGAAWDYNPTNVYLARAVVGESRSLGLPNTDLLAVSSKGEMAVLIKSANKLSPTGAGTLAQVSMSGGAPRELLEDVTGADWSSDGDELAVVRRIETGSRVEFPMGTPLYTTPNALSSLRVSPRGDRIAFMEAEPSARNVVVLDRKGARQVLASYQGQPGNLAWASDGAGVLFTSDEGIEIGTLSGSRRVLLRSAEQPVLHDVARDGRLLVESFNLRRLLVWLSPVDGREHEVSWFDQSAIQGISADGKALLFSDRGGIYFSRAESAEAIRLGEGTAMALSRDAKWALARTGTGSTLEMVLLPTGPGDVRKLSTGGIRPAGGQFLPDGRGIAWVGSEAGHDPRGYVQDLSGGQPRPFTPEGITGLGPVSPDGRLAPVRLKGKVALYPLEEGEPKPLQGLDPEELVFQWTADGKSLYVARLDRMPVLISLLEIASGTRSPWKELRPTDYPAVIGVNNMRISADGSSYAYSCGQVVHSDLYIVDGLR